MADLFISSPSRASSAGAGPPAKGAGSPSSSSDAAVRCCNVWKTRTTSRSLRWVSSSFVASRSDAIAVSRASNSTRDRRK